MAIRDEDREELTAYLDGELDEEAARAIEARLNVDPELRAEANALRQAYDLLEYLPRTEASGSFTHRTLERLALSDASTVSQARPAARGGWPWWKSLAWAAVLLLALGIGFGVASLVPWLRFSGSPTGEPPAIEEQMVRYLRLLENRWLYERVPDLEFLQGLDRPDLFGDESPDS